jgi:hypothetical protein
MVARSAGSTAAEMAHNGSVAVVLGFRPHTYWTAVVAVAGRPEAPRIVDRRRFEFAAGGERFVYHRAAETASADAPGLIADVRARTEANAARAIASLIADLRGSGDSVHLAVVPAATSKVPEKLEDIVRAHSRIHAAEGNFYRDIIAAACATAGLEVRREVERELPALVCDLLAADRSSLDARLRQMGAALGPPWREDQKLAAMAAWLHLDRPARPDRSQK